MAKYRNMYRCTKCQEEMKGFAAEKEPHFYCGDCKSHWWKGKEWSEEEWEKFVNEEV